MLDCNTLSAGDADVINTTLALIEPCLDEINVLASIGEEPISKLGGVKTLADQSGINNLELWNGLFVKKALLSLLLISWLKSRLQQWPVLRHNS